MAVRTAWIAYVNVHPFDGRADDTVFYYASARALADAFEYRDQFGRFSAHWPPGYALTLAAAFFTAGPHLAVAKALNVAIGAATCVLVYAIGARAFGRAAGLLAALILALLPGHAFWSTLVMTETLFTFVFLLCLYLLLTWTLDNHDARAWQLATLGLLLGYATLIRAEAVLLAPLFVLLWLAVLPRWRTPLRYGAIVCAAFAVVLGAWTVRNAVRFDDFVLLRTGAPGAVSNALDPNYLDRPARFTAPAPPLEDTLGNIARHPWEIAPLELNKLRHLYRNDHEAVDWAMHERPPMSEAEATRWRRVADVPYAVLMLAALLAAPLWLRVRERPRLVLAFGLLAWTAIEITFWPEPRYHTPVLPLLSVCAAAGVAWLAGTVINRTRRIELSPDDP
ncbi:MAG: glycosyltransferase family 39 protein [Dehalococcoidia bacterium]